MTCNKQRGTSVSPIKIVSVGMFVVVVVSSLDSLEYHTEHFIFCFSSIPDFILLGF